MRSVAARGRRVLVTGMSGAGKSTFSRSLAAKTGAPVIHLDLHFWEPGWVAPLHDEWRLVVVIWRNRRSQPEREREIISQHGQHAACHVLRSKRVVRRFLDALDAPRASGAELP